MISRLGDRNNLLKPSNFMNMSKIKGKENKETIRKKEKDEIIGQRWSWSYLENSRTNDLYTYLNEYSDFYWLTEKLSRLNI